MLVKGYTIKSSPLNEKNIRYKDNFSRPENVLSGILYEDKNQVVTFVRPKPTYSALAWVAFSYMKIVDPAKRGKQLEYFIW